MRVRRSQRASIKEVDAETTRRVVALARTSLAAFVRLFWPVVEPGTPLIWGWHLEAVCEHLEAVTAGELRKLAIAIPPGHCKSLLVSVMWPAWVWASRPEWRAIFASYAGDLAIRDSVRCRSIIESDTYQRAYCGPDGWQLASDQNVKSYFRNSKQGERLALGVGGKATGWRGDAVVVDDALNATEAPSEIARQNVIEWWDKAMSSRLNDMRTGAHVVIGQRLHEEDLTGHVLERGGYEYLCLPSEFDGKRRCVTMGGKWQDWRQEDGALLFPEMFPREVLDRAKVDLGSDGYASQHDQLPQPASGGMFKLGWWKRYSKLPHIIDEWVASLDATFKDTTGSDFVDLQVWAKVRADRYLVKSYRARRSFVDTCALVERAKREFPEIGPFLVEDKANGPAVLNALRGKVGGLIAVDPGAKGKEARAASVTPLVEAGNVWLPEASSGNVAIWRDGAEVETGGWEDSEAGSPVEHFIAECAAFPKGKHDDAVDALSQALNRWRATEVSQAQAPVLSMRRLRNSTRTEM